MYIQSRVNSDKMSIGFGKRCILQDVDNDGDCQGFLGTFSTNNVSGLTIASTHLTPCAIGGLAV